VPDDITVSTDYQGTVTFTNPLSIPLTNASIGVEGSSLVADIHTFK
jgi:hypothetical protein